MECSSCGRTIDRTVETYFVAALGWRKNGKGAAAKPRNTRIVRCRTCHDRGFEQMSLFEEDELKGLAS